MQLRKAAHLMSFKLNIVIPAFIKGLECQRHPSRVISETVFIDNVWYFIPREENESTNNWRIFPSMLY